MSDTRIEPQAGEGSDLPSWRFHIEKLGCLEYGDFEVKPLTLLCGPNNTGKTWAMYALYGFLDRTFNNPILPGIDEVAKEVSGKGAYSWDFGAWIAKNAGDILNIINEGLRQRLSVIFCVPETFFSESRFDWKVDPKVFEESSITRALDHKLNLGVQSNDFIQFLKPAGESKLQITLFVRQTPQQIPYLEYILSAIISNHLLIEVKFYWQVFLMPAERKGLNLFHQELASRRTKDLHPISRFELEVTNLPSYAKPIADYIDWLNDKQKVLNDTSQYQGFVGQVESIIGGTYRVDSSGKIYFTPDKSKKELDFHLSSSTVKSLFGLWFFLAHQAKVGDTLMIDEPELNLHPANQRALARVLVRLVNAGLRVVVSTHSDYIVREINSLIMLNKPHPKRAELMQRFGYVENEILSPEKVGCYLFDQSTIKAMEITEDEGILASTFDETIHDLNDTSDGIYYTYRDRAEEDTE